MKSIHMKSTHAHRTSVTYMYIILIITYCTRRFHRHIKIQWNSAVAAALTDCIDRNTFRFRVPQRYLGVVVIDLFLHISVQMISMTKHPQIQYSNFQFWDCFIFCSIEWCIGEKYLLSPCHHNNTTWSHPELLHKGSAHFPIAQRNISLFMFFPRWPLGVTAICACRIYAAVSSVP